MPRWDDEDLECYDRIMESLGDVQADLRRMIGVHLVEVKEDRLKAIRQCAEISRGRERDCDEKAAAASEISDEQLWWQRACEADIIAGRIKEAFPEAFRWTRPSGRPDTDE